MITKDDLLEHCWAMFDYWISSEYEGAMDEQFSRMINGMFSIIQEIGRPIQPLTNLGKLCNFLVDIEDLASNKGILAMTGIPKKIADDSEIWLCVCNFQIGRKNE